MTHDGATACAPQGCRLRQRVFLMELPEMRAPFGSGDTERVADWVASKIRGRRMRLARW